MHFATLVVLLVLFFATSLIGVVTGSNSLITVPVMFQLGIDEREAVATNMFGLTFMAVGGAIPFFRSGTIKIRTLWPKLLLTLVGSALGAAIVGVITGDTIRLIVTLAMFSVVAFTLLDERHRGAPGAHYWPAAGYLAVFLLAIYGGFYSGGYVTVLTPTLVAFFGMSFTESVAATKVVNAVSSGVATVVFLYQGFVDITLGIALGIAMFAGAYVGAHYALKIGEVWLRRVFISAVVLVGIKMTFDLARTYLV